MKKLLKTTALTLLLAGTMTLFTTGEVKAALQSNKNTQSTTQKTIATWLTEFRQMEQFGGALGLTETYNATTLLATSTSNNIDSHMMKSTEYGAIAILSASAYGNPSNNKDITTTTGNETGMILNTSEYKWVAGGGNTMSAFKNIDRRYFDNYQASYSTTAAKRGDALGKATDTNPGAQGWHEASASYWPSVNDFTFVRGGLGIFSFSADGYAQLHYAYGVIVCGEGL